VGSYVKKNKAPWTRGGLGNTEGGGGRHGGRATREITENRKIPTPTQAREGRGGRNKFRTTSSAPYRPATLLSETPTPPTQAPGGAEKYFRGGIQRTWAQRGKEGRGEGVRFVLGGTAEKISGWVGHRDLYSTKCGAKRKDKIGTGKGLGKRKGRLKIIALLKVTE